QKQCFDMLIVRLMHIADMPPVSEILQRNSNTTRTGAGTTISSSQNDTAAPAAPEAQRLEIKNATDLAAALQASKEILLYSYYTSNIEIVEICDGIMKYFDRRGHADFAHKMAAWLNDNTGRTYTMERVAESQHTHAITQQK